MGYRCPGCRRDFGEEKGRLADHWNVDKKCAAKALTELQKTRYTDFSMFENATVRRDHVRCS